MCRLGEEDITYLLLLKAMVLSCSSPTTRIRTQHENQSNRIYFCANARHIKWTPSKTLENAQHKHTTIHWEWNIDRGGKLKRRAGQQRVTTTLCRMDRLDFAMFNYLDKESLPKRAQKTMCDKKERKFKFVDMDKLEYTKFIEEDKVEEVQEPPPKRLKKNLLMYWLFVCINLHIFDVRIAH